jgi:hypothetical protein
MQGVRSRQALLKQALDHGIAGRPRVLHDAGAINDQTDLQAGGILSASPAIANERASRIRLDAALAATSERRPVASAWVRRISTSGTVR